MIAVKHFSCKCFFVFFCLINLLSNHLYAESADNLKLGITTTTANSGLIEELNSIFTKNTGIHVQTVIAGSGQILRNAADGDLDVVLVHSPVTEQEFISSGFGIERSLVMFNDFVLLGPKDDPVNISSTQEIQDAMHQIYKSKLIFISRGDDSGTHHKESALWEIAAIKPQGDWYLRSGDAMSRTLLLANEKQAYTLSDRATYQLLSNEINLEIVFENPEILFNPYHLILVNPERLSVNYALAKEYKKFLLSVEAKKIIRQYKIDGEVLFKVVDQDELKIEKISTVKNIKEETKKHFFISALSSAIHLISRFDNELYGVVFISLQTSIIAVLLASILFMPIGIIIGLYNFRGKRIVLSLLNTAMALPTVIVGLVLYGLINRQGFLGEFGLLYSPVAMVIGQCVLIAPIICNLSIIAVSSSDNRLLHTCSALGANLSQKIIIYISETRIALMAAIVTAFGRAIGEVGIAMMLGGNIDGYTRTMTTAIALETSKGEFEFALALGLVLLGVALVVNIMLQSFQGKS